MTAAIRLYNRLKSGSRKQSTDEPGMNQFRQTTVVLALSTTLVYSISNTPALARTSSEQFADAMKQGMAIRSENLASATHQFSLALEAARRIRNPKSEVAQAAFELAKCFELAKKPAEAIENYEQALLAAQNTVGGTYILESREAIMRLCSENGYSTLAPKLLDRSLEKLVESQSEPNVYSTPKTHDAALSILALYKQYGQYDALLKLAQRMRSKVADEQLAHSEETVYLNAIADAYYQQKQFEQAEICYKQLLIRLGPVSAESNSVPSSKNLRSRLKEILKKLGKQDELAHYDTVDKQTSLSDRFDFNAINTLTTAARSEMTARQFDKALEHLNSALSLFSNYYDGVTSSHIYLYSQIADVYFAKQDFDNAEFFYKKAMEAVNIGLESGLWKNNIHMEVLPLKKLAEFYKAQKREKELEDVTRKIENINRAMEVKPEVVSLFRKEEITGPVKVNFLEMKPILVGSENEINIEVDNAAFYKVAWKLEKLDGTDVSKDPSYGHLRPAVEWRSKASAVGNPEDINQCFYTAPLAIPPTDIYIHAQARRKGDDSVIAEQRAALKFVEPTVELTPAAGDIQVGKKIAIKAIARNIARNLHFRWHANQGTIDSNDPVYDEAADTVTLTGTYELAEKPRESEVTFRAEIVPPHSDKLIKTAEARLTVSPQP
jgi:tetratricopeptide (TPR) repeat protein